jgi:hypothetical protein
VSASLFTPAACYGLIARFARGGSLRGACADLGLEEKTVEAWLTRGRRDGSGEYADFAAAVEAARTSSKPWPMGEDELAIVVSAKAREGVVSAMELYWKMLRAPREEARPNVVDDPLAEADELARRRQTR